LTERAPADVRQHSLRIVLLIRLRPGGRASANGDLYSITTNQAAIIALFRVTNRFVGDSRDAGRFSALPK
jgi:hypothetical protein